MARLCGEVCVREQVRARREHCGEGTTAESAAVRGQVLERAHDYAGTTAAGYAHGAAPRARRSRAKARIRVGELRPISRDYDLCQVESERRTSEHTARATARAGAPMRDYTNESGANERGRKSETDPPSQRSDGETSDELVPQRATQTRRSTRASLPDDKDNFVDEA